jgi:hypothetical protein
LETVSIRSKRVFWLCVAVSLALHLAVLAGLPGLRLKSEPEPPVLQARLVAPAPSPAAKPAPAPKPPAAEKRAAARRQPQPEPPAPAPQGAQVVTAPSAAAEAAFSAPSPGPAWTDEEPSSVAAEAETPAVEAAQSPAVPDVAAAEPEAVQKTEQPAATVARQSGSIRYEVYYGSDRFSVGRSVQTWSIEENSYRLTSFSETTGLVGLFKPYQYGYVAEGRVEPDGLRPESFSVSRGREGERQAGARFDWQNRRLTYGKRGSQHSAPLDGRSYDFLTLFYQLARMPLDPGRLNFSVTTGTKYNRYTLEVGTEEPLELPMGSLRAIPIKQVRIPGEESMEVWLAPEIGYLPVLIRFFDRDGKLSAEQVATQIATDTVAGDVR